MNKEEIQVQIKELQDKLNILSSELEKCENKHIWGIRKPKYRDKYYMSFYDGTIQEETNYDSAYDKKVYESGNYWFTEEEAKFESGREKYTRLYRKYVKEHSEPMDCTDTKLKRFYAYWDMEDKSIRIISHLSYITGFQIYGSSGEVISNAIKFIGEENFKKYILQVKE